MCEVPYYGTFRQYIEYPINVRISTAQTLQYWDQP